MIRECKCGMNYGISHKLGLSFGNYQLLSNIVLLIIAIIFEKKLIGTGTFGNMILVGYSADFKTRMALEKQAL